MDWTALEADRNIAFYGIVPLGNPKNSGHTLSPIVVNWWKILLVDGFLEIGPNL